MFSRSIPFVCVALLFAAGSACTRETPQAKRDRFLTLGKKQLEKHDYAGATLQFRNAAQAMPKDPEAYYQLGLTSLGQGDLRSAVIFLRQASSLDPKHAGAQLKIAELEASTGDKALLDDAEKRVQEVLALDPNNADALNTLAVTEFRLGRPDDAEQYLHEALQKAPTNVRSYSNLAAIAVQRKDMEGAEKILKQALDAAPKSTLSWMTLGRFYVFARRPADAEAQFKKASEIDPHDPVALLDLGRTQNANGRADDAEKTFRKLSDLPDPQYKAVHASYLWQIGKTDKALAEFTDLYKKDPKNRDARTRLVSSYLKLKQKAQAEQVLTDALKKNNRDADALLQRAEIYLGEGQLDKAQADLTEAIRFKSDSATAHYLLAKVYLSTGAELLRRQELSEALKLDASLLRVRIELAEAFLSARSAKLALDLLDAAPPDQKETLPFIAMRNWALILTGDLVNARKGIDAGLAREKAAEFMLEDGVLKLEQRNTASGRTTLEEVLVKDPENLRALEALVGSYFGEKKYPEGIAKLKFYADKRPNSTLLHAYMGQVLLMAGDNAGARAAFVAAKKATPTFQPADIGLATLDMAENKLDSARQTLKGLVDGPKPNSLAAVRLGRLELSAQNYPAAIASYRKAVDLRPNDWAPANDLAYCLDLTGQPDEALKYAQKAKELSPKNPIVMDTLGWALYNKGMYDAAVRELEPLKGDRDSIPRFHLAMAYFKRGDVNPGRAVLDTALKMQSNSAEAEMAKKVAAEAIQKSN
jgi:tetratricopeptide (TPR) repeat protein